MPERSSPISRVEPKGGGALGYRELSQSSMDCPPGGPVVSVGAATPSRSVLPASACWMHHTSAFITRLDKNRLFSCLGHSERR